MSAGIAALSAGGSVNELVHAADAALYWAKAEGRDACVPYTPDQEQASRPPARCLGPPALSVDRLLAMVREQLGLSVAAVGEFTEGREIWRYLDGDGTAFGMRVGEGRPLGRPTVRGSSKAVPNLVRDVGGEERTRDLSITPRRASAPTSASRSPSRAGSPTASSAA